MLHTCAGAIRRALPRGGTLPAQEWHKRHKALLVFLWLNALGLGIAGLVQGQYGIAHNVAHCGVLVVCALLGAHPRLSPGVRQAAVSIGLLTAAAVLVHMTNGLIESHFYFFVMVIALTLYEDWRVFLLAVGYVLLHHGVLGTLDPRDVYNRPEAFAAPWKWASIHAVFVAAAGAAAIIAWRLNEMIRERMLEAQAMLADAALVDGLTELPNRRQLMADLEGLAENARPMVFALFDLDGFKTYNDTFGHSAGDVLLTRIGRRLAVAAGPPARAYRLGGDEFCVLAPADAGEADFLSRAAAALSDSGEGFAIGCSYGSALMPDEAADAEQALQLADKRMYQSKSGGRPSAGRQVGDVLLTALESRNPELGEHLEDVATLAEAVARDLDLPDDDVQRVRQAAELHDVGKVAIPDAIMLKPGPLSDDEWAFMKRHTVIGERIVAAAPALTRVAALVRSSHERIDGTGYPDGLAGDDIPLGSRIIFACDAFAAMTAHRPYRPSKMTRAEAIAELRRCAGTQFDPRVVESLAGILAPRASGVEVAA